MILSYKKTKKDSRLEKIEEIAANSWVRVESPTERELEKLAEKLNLDESILLDGIDRYEVPRLEIDDGNCYVFLRAPYRDEGGQIITVPLLVIITGETILTVSSKPLVCFSQIISNDRNFFTDDRKGAFIRIIKEVNVTYSSFLSSINKNVRGASSDMEEITNKEISQFLLFEGLMNDFLSALVPISAILGNLKSGKSIKFTEDELEDMDDIKLNTEQLIELSKSSLRTITNIREFYSTIVSDRLNRTMKILTTLTVMMTVPTIVSSFFGMNVVMPMADSPYGFYMISGATVLILGILAYIFSKNKWL